MDNYTKEGKVTTLFQDGIQYTLDPDEKTGKAMETIDSIASFFRSDELYNKICNHSYRMDFTEHSRMMNNDLFTAEVFPENRYTSERAFYFNREGQLKYYYEDDYYGINPTGRSEVLITVYELNNNVDMSLFDLSEYDITKLPDQELIHISNPADYFGKKDPK